MFLMITRDRGKPRPAIFKDLSNVSSDGDEQTEKRRVFCGSANTKHDRPAKYVFAAASQAAAKPTNARLHSTDTAKNTTVAAAIKTDATKLLRRNYGSADATI